MDIYDIVVFEGGNVMQEVQKPSKKPLIFYGILTVLILLLLNSTLFPAITQKMIISVDYTEFMHM